MRISDWSSDVFSSDLGRNIALDRHQRGLQRANRRALRGHRARQVRDRAVERGQRGRRRRADLDPKRRLLARIGGDLGGGDGAVVRHAAIARWQAADLDLATRRRRGAPRLLTVNNNPGIVARARYLGEIGRKCLLLGHYSLQSTSAAARIAASSVAARRSEEHTSELQSLMRIS